MIGPFSKPVDLPNKYTKEFPMVDPEKLKKEAKWKVRIKRFQIKECGNDALEKLYEGFLSGDLKVITEREDALEDGRLFITIIYQEKEIDENRKTQSIKDNSERPEEIKKAKEKD